jgi:hypothetical protein
MRRRYGPRAGLSDDAGEGQGCGLAGSQKQLRITCRRWQGMPRGRIWRWRSWWDRSSTAVEGQAWQSGVAGRAEGLGHGRGLAEIWAVEGEE